MIGKELENLFTVIDTEVNGEAGDTSNGQCLGRFGIAEQDSGIFTHSIIQLVTLLEFIPRLEIGQDKTCRNITNMR
jgi:hypothetical protein